MKITGMTTRILGIDPSPWYGDGPIPPDVPAVWRYPLTCISTDEGIEGWTMGYGANDEGRGSAYQLHDVLLPVILGKDPLRQEALWQELMALNRHLYPISDGAIRHARCRLLGHQRESGRNVDWGNARPASRSNARLSNRIPLQRNARDGRCRSPTDETGGLSRLQTHLL